MRRHNKFFFASSTKNNPKDVFCNPLHTDAFFLSLRDINRHRYWNHFWKIQINPENFIFFHFWDSLGQIFQKWPYFWAFEWKKKFDILTLKNNFSCKNRILEFLYKHIWIFETNFEKFDYRTFWISWELNKKLKTVDFFNMWLFIFEIEIFNFCICQKPTFGWSGLEQVSSGFINSNFCVGKVTIWRCQMILTFSGLHFIFYMTPLNFQQGLVQPPVEQKWPKRITVHLWGKMKKKLLAYNMLLTQLDEV